MAQCESRDHDVETAVRERQPVHARQDARAARHLVAASPAKYRARRPPPRAPPPPASRSVPCRTRGRGRVDPGRRATARPWPPVPRPSAGCAVRRHTCRPRARTPRARTAPAWRLASCAHPMCRDVHAGTVRCSELEVQAEVLPFVRVPPERTHAGPALGSPPRADVAPQLDHRCTVECGAAGPCAPQAAGGPAMKKHGLTRPSAPTTAENSGALQRTGG